MHIHIFLLFVVVIVIEPPDAQNLMPTRLVSLTPNDTCNQIAQHPAPSVQPVFNQMSGVINDGLPFYCGGRVNGLIGTKQCWRYDKFLDSWSLPVSMNIKRYGQGVHMITPEVFILTGLSMPNPPLSPMQNSCLQQLLLLLRSGLG